MWITPPPLKQRNSSSSFLIAQCVVGAFFAFIMAIQMSYFFYSLRVNADWNGDKTLLLYVFSISAILFVICGALLVKIAIKERR